MTAFQIPPTLHRHFCRFAEDQDGVSAIEFAMILPLMVTLYLGSVEITQAVTADRKVTLVAHTLGDLAAQSTCLTSSDVTNIFNAGKAVAYPYDTTKLKATITSVTIDSNQNATVAWSQTLNGGTTYASDVTSSIPTALKTANTSLIWAEASYEYTPAVGYVITGKIALSDKIFLRPRLTTSVSYGSCS